MMIENIITTIRLQLNEVRSNLLEWLQEDSHVLHYRPKNGGWTSSEILEHITLTSHFLLMIIDKASVKAKTRAISVPVQHDWENYELSPMQLGEIGVHKSFVWNRPEHMEPVGNVTLMEIEKRMLNQFDRCDGHLNVLKYGEGILCKTTMTVNGIGKLDVYQYIYFLILHAKRHLTQLEKNKLEFQLKQDND